MGRSRARACSQIEGFSPRGMYRTYDQRGTNTIIRGRPTVIFKTATRRYGYPLLARYNLQHLMIMALRVLFLETPKAKVTFSLIEVLSSQVLGRTTFRIAVLELDLAENHIHLLLQ